MRRDGLEQPRPGRCLVCGEPLDSRQPFWVTDPPDGEHHGCRDWSRLPFPYDHELAHLRALARFYLRGYRDVVELGRWLAEVRRTWPRGGGAALAQYRARKTALISRLERMRRPKG